MPNRHSAPAHPSEIPIDQREIMYYARVNGGGPTPPNPERDGGPGDDETVEDLRETIAALRRSTAEQFRSLQDAHDAMFGEQVLLRERIDDAVEILKYLKEEKDGYLSLIGDLSAEVARLQSEADGSVFSATIENLINEKMELGEELREERKRGEEWRRAKEELDKDRGELEKEKRKMERERREMDKTERDIEEGRQKIAALQGKRDHLQGDLNEGKAQLESLRRDKQDEIDEMDEALDADDGEFEAERGVLHRRLREAQDGSGTGAARAKEGAAGELTSVVEEASHKVAQIPGIEYGHSRKETGRKREVEGASKVMPPSPSKKYRCSGQSTVQSNKSVSLPIPANGQYYSKNEAISILSGVSTGKLKTMDAIVERQKKFNIPCSRSTLGRLMRNHSEGRATLPIPVNGQYYSKYEAISILSGLTTGKLKTMDAITEQQKKFNIPCSRRTLGRMMKKHQEGGAIPNSEWSGKGWLPICTNEDIKEIAEAC